MLEPSTDAVVVETFSPNLQNIQDNHIGYGKAQWKLSASLAMLMPYQGAQTIAIGLVLPIIKKHFHFTTAEQAVGLTFINIGMPIGSFLQGFSDNLGRKKIVLVDALILLIFGAISVFSLSFPVFVASHFFCEVGIGMSLLLVAAYLDIIDNFFNSLQTLFQTHLKVPIKYYRISVKVKFSEAHKSDLITYDSTLVKLFLQANNIYFLLTLLPELS